MSSGTSSNTTAEQDIKQYLSNNADWHEVNPIAVATGYSNGHVRSTAKRMANDGNSPVEGRKNHRKPVVGYIFNGDMEVPGSDRQTYIRLIQIHTSNPPSNLQSMSLDALQKRLRRVADDSTRIESKLEFRIP